MAAILVLSACLGCAEPEPSPPPQAAVAVEAGDLAQIVESGQLRVLLPLRVGTDRLPRKGRPLFDYDRELAAAYAEQLGVDPVLIYVESREELIPSLLEGRGDLVAANLTVTPERKKSVAFTVPVAVVREQLVTRSDDVTFTDALDLIGRRIAVRRSSSFWDTVNELRNVHPGLEIQEVPENVDTEEVIHRVAVGVYDVTVADSNLVEDCLEYRGDVKAALNLTHDRPIAWAVRPGSVELLKSLDRFLTTAQLTNRTDELLIDDFDQIKRRRVLRMITRNNAATYFLWRGQLKGFEYELVRHFARQHRLRLEVVVPPPGEDALRWLVEGRGDLVAAALSPTEERRSLGVAFSRPYNYGQQMIVSRADDERLREPADLAGRSVAVRRSSSYWQTLEQLRESGIPLELVAAPEEMETEEIIGLVASGEYDLTLADSHIVNIELTWRDDIKTVFPLTEPLPWAWAVRDSNPQLVQAADAFIANEYRSLHYNVVYDRYFRDSRRILDHIERRVDVTTGISPYDELIKKYAEMYDFDWRLIVSLMYQESRFRPDARSFAGAHGLMQMLPSTAQELGFEDLTEPEQAIHAGVKYLDWVRDRFEAELAVRDRMWFTLAAYNAGAGHVRDARRLAAVQGLDPNRWFGNVEQAMLLLSRSQYFQAAQHGYCRCTEPVNYVREIRSRYNAYAETL
jgi:membrane-bound lytic murein transglycosylase F